ncbi:hypothetical protein GCM10023231_37960 [Olivibacter ginsenosidimutans]|uniref:Histidine kinase domain-containing protein n=1 Tax=Olivibacter ginsenosidimutans TaxID=1176537 RepID=A0ABP9C693_9SPHI
MGVFIFSTFVLLVFSLGYGIYYHKQRMAEQERKLRITQHQQQRQEEQMHYFQAMVQGQERERKRLAIDLHDRLGGLLANIKLLLSKNPNSPLTPELLHQRQTALVKLDTAVNELRRIARNMMPETLLRFGLVAALRDFCEDLEHQGINIVLQTYDFSPDIDKQQQITLYRILQELINNAVKHAHAQYILVQCMQNDDKIYLTVEDDGKGFDVEKEADKKGTGFYTIKNRVAYLNGQLDIQSEPKVGTTITIEFNLQSDATDILTYC